VDPTEYLFGTKFTDVGAEQGLFFFFFCFFFFFFFLVPKENVFVLVSLISL
jgi:hypothetical protein